MGKTEKHPAILQVTITPKGVENKFYIRPGKTADEGLRFFNLIEPLTRNFLIRKDRIIKQKDVQ